jgi:hypothetical protein
MKKPTINLKMKSLFFSLALLTTIAVNAQEFTIKKLELTSETIILHYDLIDTLKGRTYTVNVYSSKDSYLAPLSKVKGDVGLPVRPGADKKIIWNSKEELGATFKGEIELEVRGKAYIPFVKFEGFQEEQVIKRGKPKTMIWSGGTRQNILNFSIYRGDTYIDVIPNVANTGSYELTIPKSVKPGKGYYFLVSDAKNKDQVMKTDNFIVKRKIPLALQLLPLAIAGGVVTLLGEKTPDDLEEPPGTPGSKN